MRIRTVIGLATVLILIATVSSPVRAIAVCYDYVYFRLTGIDPDPPRGGGTFPLTLTYLSAADVEKLLVQKEYAALQTAPSGGQLMRGDVIFVPGHVGFANGPNNISDFLQAQGTTNPGTPMKYYNVNALPAPLPPLPGATTREAASTQTIPWRHF